MAEHRVATRQWQTRPCTEPLAGVLHVPGDKSISHRAVLLAALAEGETHIRGFLEGEDTRATARVMQQLGVQIEAPRPGERVVRGVGLHGLNPPDAPLECGNSGTAMRLLCGLLAAQPFTSCLVGDTSLARRPMDRVADPLRAMGARISLSNDGTAPIRIDPAQSLHGIRHQGEVASAQVKSALLLAGLYAHGVTEVLEVTPTRDYTETMLSEMGAAIEFAPGFARIRKTEHLQARDVQVPADFSSAAFSLVAATLVPGSRVRLPAVGMNPRRTGLLDVLRSMGARIEVSPVAGQAALFDIEVSSAELRGTDVPTEHVADMIDEFPILFIAAACARGVTRVRGAAELRVKESDRIARMADGLRSLGIRVDETHDGADIHGGTLQGGRVDSGGDHRIAMAFAVAGLCARGPVEILDVENVETSYPGFVKGFSALGAGISEV